VVYLSRFVDEPALHQSVPGCPLAQLPPKSDESACASCRFNVAFPRTPQIGCHLRTPPDVMDAARAQLAQHDPALADELRVLRTGDAVEGARAAQFVSLAERWLRSARHDAEREVASTILRFARAASLRAVEIVR
jgi:hypothetical protein